MSPSFVFLKCIFGWEFFFTDVSVSTIISFLTTNYPYIVVDTFDMNVYLLFTVTGGQTPINRTTKASILPFVILIKMNR